MHANNSALHLMRNYSIEGKAMSDINAKVLFTESVKNRYFRRGFITLMCVAVGLGCWKYIIDAPGYWGDIAQLANADVAGEVIDCKELQSAVIESEFGYNETVLDFEYDTGQRFTQCRTEIDEMRSNYCSKLVYPAAQHLLGKSGYSAPGSRVFASCKNELKLALSAVKYTYTLPSREIKFLVLNDLGEMIDPSLVTKISFRKEVFPSEIAVWAITLHTEEKCYDLYFSDKADWETAKHELAILASNNLAQKLGV